MRTIDLTPFYRTTVGLDRLASLLDSTSRAEQGSSSYPPYDIEIVDEHHYAISLAVAGFTRDELDIQIECGVLTVKGKKAAEESERKYLHQGVATRTFERKFSLADRVEITSAKLTNGLLIIELKHELPEAMKPKRIEISSDSKVLEHKTESDKAA